MSVATSSANPGLAHNQPVIFQPEPPAQAPPAQAPPAQATFQSASATSPGPGPAGAQLSKRLLDWNQVPPDGSDAAVQTALRSIAGQFQGEVYLGLTSTGGSVQQFGSSETESQGWRRQMTSALAETSAAPQACLFAAAGGQSSMLLQELRNYCGSPLVFGFGVTGNPPAGPEDRCDVAGVVVCTRPTTELRSKDDYAALIAHTQAELGAWLRVWTHSRAGLRALNRYRWLVGCRSRRGLLCLAGVVGLLCSLAIPVPYWPQRPCTIEPVSKSFVASPYDGRIRQALVRPGDVVTRGQLLARMDDEQLHWQLSTATADYETASKKRDTALATRAGGELRLAQLEQERIAIQIESLEQQLAQLELRSPMDGIVVQGDWYQTDGAPVTRGEMLFEIAALEQMRVEVQLATEDLAQVEVGHLATVRVDAAPGTKWSANIDRIDPRGKVVDTQVVFAASADVSNETLQLRPGMQGTARLTAGKQTIGWLLFHRPYLWAMKKLAW